MNSVQKQSYSFCLVYLSFLTSNSYLLHTLSIMTFSEFPKGQTDPRNKPLQVEDDIYIIQERTGFGVGLLLSGMCLQL